ncbi:MAG: hypothetical protein ACOZB1_15120 [Pseudomonadota bacterium]|jgi:heat shock protein HtpX
MKRGKTTPTPAARIDIRSHGFALTEAARKATIPGAAWDKSCAFGITGGRGAGFKRLFMTPPPLEERIAALRQGA